MHFGLDRFIAEADLRAPFRGKRVALLAHPASVTADLKHALDVFAELPDINLTAAFGPQHGLKGDKQDNMVESPDEIDPFYHIPLFSLYGEVRKPTPVMMETFDVIFIDLQDLGCRIYTFITTLRYILEAAAQYGKTVCVLDRPNPIGRPVEGFSLRPGWESFVGAGAMPMRHGLTMGELALWFIDTLALNVDFHVIPMEGWHADAAPDFGWPSGRIWINPSPNAPNINMARCYAGSVMLEGTTLSEGRGTTRPLELWGAPDLAIPAIMQRMQQFAPTWLSGCHLRPCWFEPTFHKHQGKLCAGIHVHAEGAFYQHQQFYPWRLQALAFKAIRLESPQYPLWRDFPYEYEADRLAIDVINGSPLLRQWVDDEQATADDLQQQVAIDEEQWQQERRAYLLYQL